MTRYYLSTDQSSHWYIVPVERRAEWEAWRDLSEDDERAWEAPEFAKRINGSPSFVTFTDPQDA